MTVLPMTHSLEAPRQVRASSYDFGYEHEVQISLPPSYHTTDRDYPVLWVTDGNIRFDLAASIAAQLSRAAKSPEFIVVGVGQPRDTPFETFSTRRLVEFFPMEDLSLESVGEVETWKHARGGHAREFLAFIVDELRPALAQELRMQPDRHTLAGTSGGGYFATYALLTRPSSFASYLIASPAYELGHSEIFDLEAEYAEHHDDLPAKVFFTGGAEEIADPSMGAIGIITSMVRMATTLNLRAYPSLTVSCRVLDDESHGTVTIDSFSRGIRHLWPDDPTIRLVGQPADDDT